MPEKSRWLARQGSRESGCKDFASAIVAEGLEDRLNGQGLMGITTLGEGPFTIFLPVMRHLMPPSPRRSIKSRIWE